MGSEVVNWNSGRQKRQINLGVPIHLLHCMSVIVLYCIALHCIALYRIKLYCILYIQTEVSTPLQATHAPLEQV